MSKELHRYKEFLNESKNAIKSVPKIELGDKAYFENGAIYEVIAVNDNSKEVKIKDFKTSDVKIVSFDNFYYLRHESGTPVVYFKNGKEMSGEVILRDGEKKISLYKDDNYSGMHERIVTPDWNFVFKFSEVS